MKTILNEDLKYPLINITGKLQSESDVGILFVYHYDSPEVILEDLANLVNHMELWMMQSL